MATKMILCPECQKHRMQGDSPRCSKCTAKMRVPVKECSKCGVKSSRVALSEGIRSFVLLPLRHPMPNQIWRQCDMWFVSGNPVFAEHADPFKEETAAWTQGVSVQGK